MMKGQSKVVDSTCEILSCFSHDCEEIGVNALAKKLNMYPSKIHRILASLVNNGFLEKNPKTKKYRVGLRLFEMGLLFPLHSELRKIIRPHALELGKSFGTNVQLGILSKFDPRSVVVIDRILNLNTDSAVLRIYSNVPLHASSVGKALLAFSEDGALEEILSKIELERFTDQTIVDEEVLREQIKEVRKNGYATDEGETVPNLYCIGAPIMGDQGVLAGISVSDTPEKITQNRGRIINRILKISEYISYQLGT
jgi:DNA-binding IclR family transcriptional regulator